MAKPKGTAIVGWATDPRWEEGITVLAEKDVDQKKNRKIDGVGQSWSSGHIVRQLGVVKRVATRYGTTDKRTSYHVYTHSQVSNGKHSRYAPPSYIGLTREDMEWLVSVFLRELTTPAE